MLSWDNADSEHVLYVGVDRNGSEFVGHKFTHSLTHSALYISTDVI